MTARRVIRTTARTDSARPADVTATLFRKPLTEWFAAWKAQKAQASTPSNATTRQSSSGEARLPG